LLLLAATATVAGASGCGDVRFHLAPFTPQKVELLYADQEHVSVVRWRVDASPPLEGTEFELWGPDGYRRISFADSVFPGGITACADGHGACAQYVFRGKLELPDHTHLVRAVQESYGTLLGTEAKSRTITPTLGMDAFFRPQNDMVYVNTRDQIGADGPYVYPRTFERAISATKTVCSDEAPEGVSFSTVDASGGFPPETPLTDEGIYCVWTRPIPVDGGERAAVVARIATWPEVETVDASFVPPVEVSPIIYQIVFDLEIVPDRCAQAISTIEAAVRDNLRPSDVSDALVKTRQLPTINLAPNGTASCTQATKRQVPAEGMAQEIKQAVTQFPEVHQQYHLLYFNNLDAPLPGTLNESFRVLFDALGSPPGYDLLVFPWMFNPGLAALTDEELGWNITTWSSFEDPGLPIALSSYASRLPYRTQTHDYEEPVPLMDAPAAAAHEGQLIKICSASPEIVPVTTKPSVQEIRAPSWPISADDPPAYKVYIRPQIAAPAGDFIETSSLVRYQMCKRYCTGHPYVALSGSGQTSWAESTACSKEN
jgi:hypothetical protein